MPDGSGRRCVVVPFHGFPGRSGELSHSQLYMWHYLRRVARAGGSCNLLAVVDVPRATTVPRIVSALREALRRHEALRTVYPLRGDGTPFQVALSAGAVDLVVLDVADAEFDESGVRAARELGHCSFDLTADVPVRGMFVRAAGRDGLLWLSVPHIAIDGWGKAALQAALAALIAGDVAGPSNVRQPIDQAARERSEQGRAASDAALRQLRTELRALPAVSVAPKHQPGDPRYQEFVLVSGAAGRAAQDIADRCQVALAAVPLAACAAVVSSHLAASHAAFWVVVHNRFAADLQRAVGCYFRDVLGAPITTAGRDFDDVVRQANRCLLTAGRNARIDPGEQDRLLRELRGSQPASQFEYCYYNFVGTWWNTTGSRDRSASGNAAASRSGHRISRGAGSDVPGPPMYVKASLADGRLTMQLFADTAYLHAAEAEALLTRVADVLVRHGEPA